MAFSPDGQRIVTGSNDHTAKVWDAASGKELATLKGHTNIVSSVTFSPDGQRIATAGWDGTAKIWNAVSGRELLTITDDTVQIMKGQTVQVNSVAFSPDGKRIVTGSGADRGMGCRRWPETACHKRAHHLAWPSPRMASELSPGIFRIQRRCGTRPAAKNWSHSRGMER